MGHPVAVLLVAVLMYFRDTDHPNPFEMVATLMEQMPSGSYLAITHPAPDFNPEEPPANPRLVYYWAGIGRKP
jgi:S-adenosyl methyltransferase